mgnify:CR=1 FL=1
MKIVISPAKSLDFETKVPTTQFTEGVFLDEAEKLSKVLKKKSPKVLSKLMNISPKLGELNWQRNQDWNLPFSLENARQAVYAFNGEVYNYSDIKKELLSLNHQFVGHSDTEVILHAFAEWGITCIDKFIGMFAFVIFDAAERKLIAFRDRVGVKPFYYYYDDDLFLFASELKAFHQQRDLFKAFRSSHIG